MQKNHPSLFSGVPRRDSLSHWDHKLLGLCEAGATGGLFLSVECPGWRKEEPRTMVREP